MSLVCMCSCAWGAHLSVPGRSEPHWGDMVGAAVAASHICGMDPTDPCPGLTARHPLGPQPSGHRHLQQLPLLWHERKRTLGTHSQVAVNWALREVFLLFLP